MKIAKVMNTYLASYTDKHNDSTWDLYIFANNYRAALKDARKAQHGLMAGCKLYYVRRVAQN